MYCVGLTGNIASGKSTALQYFAALNIKTISADAIAREITQSNQHVHKAIQDHFGSHVLLPTGKLNRRELRKRITTDPKQRRWLEQLLHPLIRHQIEQDIASASGPYCVIEIPLLFKREDFPYLNQIILITADPNTQLARMVERDHCSYEEAQALLNLQPKDELRRAIADHILTNNQTTSNLKQAILTLHQHLMQTISN